MVPAIVRSHVITEPSRPPCVNAPLDGPQFCTWCLSMRSFESGVEWGPSGGLRKIEMFTLSTSSSVARSRVLVTAASVDVSVR